MQNPLAIYKMSDPNINWPDIAAKTGIGVTGLIKLAEMPFEKIQGIQVRTYFKLKEELGIDMYNFKRDV
jgi:hypothetical protein